ncbi:hypothetical protein [Hymenobacter sediminicola]|uniref:Uncharacterized protein n=1 Tax=Hymenobacter sediminicola TaxID=2761579 RepID=A0A7G7W314_9BACT|nr:hypothetical protein [Hymenobacter sediminicola]QNH60757.1 hypothetical protein H4317_11200 [Hymenobacter sediminicola]
MANRDVLRFPSWQGPLPADAILWFTDVASDQEYRITPEQLVGGATGAANALRGTNKIVSYLQPFAGMPAGMATRESLLPGSLCPEVRCIVLNSALPAEAAAGVTGKLKVYVLALDPEGPLTTFADAGTGTATVRCAWVEEGTIEAALAGTPRFNNLREQYPLGFEVKEIVDDGALLLFQAEQEMFRETFDDDRIPAPTRGGNAYWKEISPSPYSHRQNTDAGTLLDRFIIQLASQNQEQGLQRTMLGFGKGQGGRPTMLALRWQNEDNSPAAVLEVCYDFKSDTNYEADPDLEQNQWEPLGGGPGGLRVFDGNPTTALAGQQWLFPDDGIYVALSDFEFEENPDASGDWELLLKAPREVFWASLPLAPGNYTTIAQYLTNALNADPRLPVTRPSGRTVYVEGSGQLLSGERGNPSRPFVQFSTGISSAQPGDTVEVRVGGTNTVSGRAAYSTGVTVDRNLVVQGIGRPQLWNTDLGFASSSLMTSMRLLGLVFTKPMQVVPNSTVARRIEFEHCDFGPEFYLRLERDLTPTDQLQVIRFTRCTFDHQRTDFAFIEFNSSTVHTQRYLVEFLDCTIRIASKPLAGGIMRNDMLPQQVKLLGTTTLELVAGQALGAVTNPTSVAVPDTFWYVDQRLTAGPGPGTDVTELVAQFAGGAAQETTLLIYADAAGTFQLYSSTGVSAVSYKKNGAAQALPITVAAGDTLSILATGTGTVRLRKI